MDAEASALLSHVVSNIESNVDFLLQQGYITQQDASVISQKLPRSQPTSAIVPPPARAGPPIAPKPAPPPVVKVHARALWSYNENGEVHSIILLCRKPELTAMFRTQRISHSPQMTLSKSSKRQMQTGGREKYTASKPCFPPPTSRSYPSHRQLTLRNLPCPQDLFTGPS
jgi:hypothetical protein